ncbi:hypothetical protein [Clostridium lacusfryxellense]|uniref:hypothetical protein n=1 Tax=Clostridium lacusfryxellense TaxID=205328 RepID=UPI001C0C3739|nr:hypothetical protein [Clostridium lacusfryxellense]MBU3111945.1 hypothetical protein [Clostridium lacusfryxellense]
MKKKILRYIIMLMAITLLFFGVSIVDKLVETYQKDSMGNTIGFVFEFIVYCIAGMIFGVEKLISETKMNGHWKINLPRLILVGLPSFFVGMIVFLIFTFPINSQILTLSFANSNLFISFMQMLFGYILVTSFYKVEKISLTND